MRQEELVKLLGLPQLPNLLEQVQFLMERCIEPNHSLSAPARYLLEDGGKLRPMLALTVASARRPNRSPKIIKAAAAVEFAHLASLAHDDISDKTIKRRGKLSIVSRFGSEPALLAGDYLLALAADTALSAGSEAASIILTAIKKMSIGQAAEHSQRGNLDRELGEYLDTSGQKTGSLFAAACHLGALYGGFANKEISLFEEYGQKLGLIYQLLDDIMDIFGDPAQSAKSVGLDFKNGIYTLPVIKAAEFIPKEKNERQQLTLTKLRKIILENRGLAEAINAIQELNAEAARCLMGVTPTKTIQGLAVLPTRYLNAATLNLPASKLL